MANFFYPITPSIKQFFGTDGLPLNGGYIFCGVANRNPETSPTQMYWDAAGLIPAAQPIRTMAGYPIRGGQNGTGGTPANIYAPGDFSMTVRNSQLGLVYSQPTSVDIQLALSIAGASSAAAIPIADAGNYYTTDNVEAAFQQLGPLFAQMVTSLAALVPTGATFDYPAKSTTLPPTGYLFCDGTTIGNTTSGATHADTTLYAALYTLLWNNSTNSELQLQDSSGTNHARGASASNDFSGSFRLALPDCRGRVRAGLGTMGNTSDAARLTAAGSGITGTTSLTAGGVQTYSLVIAELASHTHTVTDPQHNHTQNAHTHPTSVAISNTAFAGLTSGANGVNTITYGSSGAQTATNIANSTGITNQNAGSGTAHQNTQPTIIFSTIIKL